MSDYNVCRSSALVHNSNDPVEVGAQVSEHYLGWNLPIMLTRYAVAEIDSRSPRVKEPFVEPTIIIGQGYAQYTQRLLSGGYVYVYDEAKAEKAKEQADKKNGSETQEKNADGTLTAEGRRIHEKAWSVYEVDYNGDTRLISSGGTTRTGEGSVPCGLLLNLPSEPGKIWLVYSHTLWTEDVFDRFADAEVRANNMREFDVGAWMNESLSVQPHTGTVNKAETLVAELSPEVKMHYFSFSTSPFSQKMFKFEFDDVAAALGITGKVHDPVLGDETYTGEAQTVGKRILSDIIYGMVRQKEASGQKVPLELRSTLWDKIKKTPFKNVMVQAYQAHCSQLNKCPIIALEDAPSIASDLVQMMLKREKLFLSQHAYLDYTSSLESNKDKLVWKLATANTIDSLKNTMPEQAENQAIEHAETYEAMEDARFKEKGSPREVMAEATAPVDNGHPARELEAIPDLLKTINNKRAKAWGKYQDSYYNHSTDLTFFEQVKVGITGNFSGVKTLQKTSTSDDYDTFKEGYKYALERFNKERIAPLDEAFCEWMKSDVMRRYFEYHHSKVELRSGCDFAGTLSNCIASVQEQMGGYTLITKWLLEDNTDNLIIKALTFNNDHIATKIKKFSSSVKIDDSFEASALPWNGIINEIQNILNQDYEIKTLATNIAGNLVSQFFGGVFNTLKEITLKPALAMASVLNRSALTRIPSTFTLGEAVGAITEDLVRKAGGSKTQIEKAVQRQLKSLRARRVDLSSPVKQDFLLMIDQEEFEKLASKINRTQNFAELLEKRGKLGRMHLPFVKEQQAANFAALHGTAKLVTPAEHRAATLERWRVSVDNIAPPMKAGGLPALCAAVQVWMVTDSWKTLKTVTPETALVTYGRFASGVAGVLGSAVEAYGAFRESILSAKLSPKVAIDNAAMIKRAGKAIGGFAGGATAIFDFMEMGGAIKAGQNGMASLYFISGLTGSASFFIFFIGSREALKQTAIRLGAGFLLGGPIAWALLIISVGVSLAIIINKDDPLQEWLGKTPFGKRDDGFNSLEDQLKAMTELSSTTQ